MSEHGLKAAGHLFTEAARTIEEACRVLTREASEAPKVLHDFSTSLNQNPGRMHPAPEASMQELTKLAVELADRGREVGAYGLWLRGEDSA